MSAGKLAPLVIHGWTVFAHPLFLEQLETLTEQVVWVNDEGSRRAYESSDDAYRVFRKMLESGHPPDDWSQLLAERSWTRSSMG